MKDPRAKDHSAKDPSARDPSAKDPSVKEASASASAKEGFEVVSLPTAWVLLPALALALACSFTLRLTIASRASFPT